MDGYLTSASKSCETVEILTIMRHEEREVLLPIGMASVERDEQGHEVVAFRLALLERRMFLPLWDLLVLAGLHPKVVSRILRRRQQRIG